MPEKTYTVTWNPKKGEETNRVRVDKVVLLPGEPKAGVSEDQVNRLQESFPDRKFTVEEGDTTSKDESGSGTQSGQSQGAGTKGGSVTPPPTP